MIIATHTQGNTVTALAIISGRELEITVNQVITYSNPNTWEIVVKDLETGEWGSGSFPRGEDWTAARFYNVVMYGEDYRIEHPRTLAGLVETALSPGAFARR